MTDQINLEIVEVTRRIAQRDKLPNPLHVPFERRCNHMKALSLGNFYHFHIPDQGFQALVCYPCMLYFRALKGTFFLASDPVTPPAI